MTMRSWHWYVITFAAITGAAHAQIYGQRPPDPKVERERNLREGQKLYDAGDLNGAWDKWIFGAFSDDPRFGIAMERMCDEKSYYGCGREFGIGGTEYAIIRHLSDLGNAEARLRLVERYPITDDGVAWKMLASIAKLDAPAELKLRADTLKAQIVKRHNARTIARWRREVETGDLETITLWDDPERPHRPATRQNVSNK